MGIKNVFKKNKKSSSLAKYTIGELESLKTIYEKQLENFNRTLKNKEKILK